MLRNIEPLSNQEFEPIVDPGQVSGFQSPAKDYQQDRLNILSKLISDPTNTFYSEVETDEMDLFGIKKGTILIVDRSINPTGGMLVVAWHKQGWCVRQLLSALNRQYLTTGKEGTTPEPVLEDTLIWGVVTWSCSPQMETKRYVRAGRL